MKIPALLIGLLLPAYIASAQHGSVARSQQPACSLRFAEEVHDFGEVALGTYVACDFEFTNTGGKSFVIDSIKSISGSKTIEWTTSAIKNKGKGRIHVRFPANDMLDPHADNSILVYSRSLSAPYALAIHGKAVDLYIGSFLFNEYTHNFAKIPQGPNVECDFEFTNTGNTPIIVSNVQSSSGSLMASWPKEPIPPGCSGKIHAIYHTYGSPGNFNKTLTVHSNARQQPTTLYITGEVNPMP